VEDKEMKRRFDSGFYKTVAGKNRKRMDDPEYYERFMKSINNPDRLEKISIASKETWKRLKRDKSDTYYRIINSGQIKTFFLTVII
jgi:hypothetical protein